MSLWVDKGCLAIFLHSASVSEGISPWDRSRQLSEFQNRLDLFSRLSARSSTSPRPPTLAYMYLQANEQPFAHHSI